MEQVFEDFVTDSFRRYQHRYTVTAQSPQASLATINNRRAFAMKPDVSLWRRGKVAFILDAKWKRIDSTRDYPKHKINQDDLYQLHAYGSRHACDAVALVYPKNRDFGKRLEYRFFDGLWLLAVPFDVTNPQTTTKRAIDTLEALPPTSQA